MEEDAYIYIGLGVAAGFVMATAIIVLLLFVVKKRYYKYTATHSRTEARSYSKLFSVYAFLFVPKDKPATSPQFVYTVSNGAAEGEISINTQGATSTAEQTSGNNNSNGEVLCRMTTEHRPLHRIESPIRKSAGTYTEIDLSSGVSSFTCLPD